MCESKKKFALHHFEIEFKPITIVFSIIWWLCACESISLVALEIIESLNQTIVGNSFFFYALIMQLIMIVFGWQHKHGGGVVSTVASQQKGSLV